MKSGDGAALARASLLPGYTLPFLAGLALYGFFLGNPTVFDDIPFFDSGFLEERKGLEFGLTLRWFGYGSLAWTRALLGEDLVWHRLVNIFLHSLNGAMLAALVQRLLDSRPTDEGCSPPRAKWAGIAIGTLFVLHPVAVYGAAYLVQRTILLAALFSLATWLALWEGAVRKSYPWLAASVACFFLAAFSKEHAVAAPAVAVLLLWLVPGTAIQHLRFAAPAFAGYFAIALAVTAMSRGLLGTAYEPAAADMLRAMEQARGVADPFVTEYAHPLSVLFQSLLFFKYVLLWMIPNPAWMAVDIRVPFPSGFLQWPYIAGPLLFCAWLAGGIVWFHRAATRLAGFALLAPLVLFVVEFSAVRIQEPFVLYRSYLWMPLSLLVVALLLARVASRGALWITLTMAFVLAVASADRLRTFSDRLILWQDSARLVRDDVPGAGRIYRNIAYAYRERGEANRAIEMYTRAARVDPAIALTYNDRGAIYLEMGNVEYASRDFTKARELIEQSKPDSVNRQPVTTALAYYNSGLVHQRLGHMEEAMRYYNLSLSFYLSSSAYNNRGALFLRSRQYGDALSDFENALLFDRRNASAHHGRAMALRALGDTHSAIEGFRAGCEAGYSRSCAALHRLASP